jgi:hypothetical protein
VEGDDFIAEESRCFAFGMRDQRLFFREFQLEFFSQERSELLFDFFGF